MMIKLQKKWNCLRWIVIIFLGITGLYSCNDENDFINPSTVFRYNEHANVTTLDPAFAKDQRNIWVCNQLYNGLVSLDEDLNIVPDLAESWTVSADSKTYTFKIKEGILFHQNQVFVTEPEETPGAKAEFYNSTRAVKAQDFKYSLERLTDPDLASPGAWTMEQVNHIEAIDDLTLRIELKDPYPAFLGILSMKYCSVIPEGAVDFYGSRFRSNPIGTGPFYLKRWEENMKMVLRRNELYHEKDADNNPLPYLEAVAISFKPDKQSEFLEFVQGNIDFVNGLDPSYKDELLTSEGTLRDKYKTSVKLEKQPFLNTEYLGLNLKEEGPLQSLMIRKALNIGFDRTEMIKYLRNNIGRPANRGFIPLGLPAGGLVNGFEYDLKKAKALVESYKKEQQVEEVKITISTGANYLDLCEYVQNELEKIGLSVNVEVMPPSTLRQMRKSGKLGVFRSSWIADYPDAQNYMALFYSKNKTPAGSNYTFFENKAYDSLYTNSLKINKVDERLQLYRKMDSIIIEEAPIIPLFYDESVRFISKNVTGLGSNAVNMLELKKVRKR